MTRPPAQIVVVNGGADRAAASVRAVQRVGHRVELATSTAEFRNQRGRTTPDVILFTPETWADGGADLMDWIAGRGGRTRAVLIGGEAQIDRPQDFVDDGIHAVLLEPLSIAELDATIDDQLGIADSMTSSKQADRGSKGPGSMVVTYSSLPAVGAQSSRPELREAVVALADDLRAGRLRLHGLSTTAADLQRLLTDPKATLAAITDKVGQDANLAAAVLRSGNAAAFRGRTPTSDLMDAGRRLGVRRMAEIVQTEIMRGLYRGGARGWGALLGAMRKNTLCTAQACRLLAVRLGDPSPGTVYTMGLFANLGEILVVDLYRRLDLPPPDGAVASGSLVSDMDAQHAALGALLLRSWQLPTALQGVAFAHHDPTVYPTGTPMNRHCWMIAGAHGAVIEAGATYKDPHAELDAVGAAASALGLSAEDLREVAKKAMADWAETQGGGPPDGGSAGGAQRPPEDDSPLLGPV